MGQKVNPISFRLGINRSWNSQWHSGTHYAELFHQDLQIQHYLESVYQRSGVLVGDCQISRHPQQVQISLMISEAVRKKGIAVDAQKVQLTLEKLTKSSVSFSVQEVSIWNHASLLAKEIGRQMEERQPFGILLKKAIQSAMNSANVEGIKVQCSGRLNGEEIARTEWLKEGRVPLHTLNAKIDYASSRAYTIYGVCGIKVWLCMKS
uniref:Small ribosomal subunit protein uS3c n=1 Tax=Andalucia godoyi TaxID=505711 RepID=M4Q9E4_ANDGO|nr:ribosomal protein S3 [Andalucia godoyi]AGH23981.1 ribosomal protein S3 [Andalucia godoyi]